MRRKVTRRKLFDIASVIAIISLLVNTFFQCHTYNNDLANLKIKYKSDLKILKFEILEKPPYFIGKIIQINWHVEGTDTVMIQYANCRKQISQLGSVPFLLDKPLLTFDDKLFIQLIAKKGNDSIVASIYSNVNEKPLPPPPPPPTTISINGTVLDQNSNAIKGVKIALNISENGPVTSDNFGKFKLIFQSSKLDLQMGRITISDSAYKDSAFDVFFNTNPKNLGIIRLSKK
jgi:hypothetical protein